MELKKGMYCMDVNGAKQGPMRWEEDDPNWDYYGSEGYFSADGMSSAGRDLDLIAEWVEENNGPDLLCELGLAEGDVVQLYDLEHDTVKMIDGYLCVDVSRVEGSVRPHWTVISRAAQTAPEPATPEPAKFGKLSDADQGALLLAKNRGFRIEYWCRGFFEWMEKGDSVFYNDIAYRIAPPRVTGTVEIIHGKPDFTTWKETK